MDLIKSPLFDPKIKKCTKSFKEALDKNIKIILENPMCGNLKKGDLQNIRVYKFKFHQQEYLLAYRIDKDTLQLITIDNHENFYRDLKNYI